MANDQMTVTYESPDTNLQQILQTCEQIGHPAEVIPSGPSAATSSSDSKAVGEATGGESVAASDAAVESASDGAGVGEGGHEPDLEAAADAFSSSMAKALETARQEGKPIVLDFMAEWCAPCRRLAHDTLEHPDVVERKKDFVLIKIDTDEYPELAKRFQVTALPDVRFFSSKGELVAQRNGFMTVDEFLAQVDAALRHGSDRP